MNNYFEDLGRIHAKDLDEKSMKTSAISFQLPEKKLQKLDYFCKAMGITRSKFIHMLLENKPFHALEVYMNTSKQTIDQLNLPENIKTRFQTYLYLHKLSKNDE